MIEVLITFCPLFFMLMIWFLPAAIDPFYAGLSGCALPHVSPVQIMFVVLSVTKEAGGDCVSLGRPVVRLLFVIHFFLLPNLPLLHLVLLVRASFYVLPCTAPMWAGWAVGLCGS
jgi:hypothetical protein